MRPFTAARFKEDAMIVGLTLLGAFVAVLFLSVVAIYVSRITRALERIGGDNSLLAKITYGVRAIEVETGAIPTQVVKLNASLGAAGGGLTAIDETLKRIIDAAAKQVRST